MTQRPDPFPKRGSQQWRILEGLLRGDKITPISAIIEYNCTIPAARCAELRKLGWPIRVLDMPHPNQSVFPGATLPVYLIDAHFREWASQAPDGTHPAEYKSADGRGKFA